MDADVASKIGRGFFENEELRRLIDRASDYVQAGVCVHFSGTAGVGKTSLALRVAEELGQPVAFMAGNEWLTSQDFIGREVGTTTSTVVDRYVQSVRRTEKKMLNDWRDSILAVAMEKGHTLIYDEFTRATPEANATLLSVLEEGILVSTDRTNPRAYLRAHPNFRIIMTSNPHDYLGVNAAPDALLDRVVTMPVEEPGPETMAEIVSRRTGLSLPLSRKVVGMVSHLRSKTEQTQVSTLRSALLIARILHGKERASKLTDFTLIDVATNVLVGRGMPTDAEQVGAALNRTAKAA
jgi:gas vesicle protein GvpN